MIRRFSALALALCLNSVSVYAQAPAAQGTQLTVNTASEVHKFPTVASAVIGNAQRGMVLEIKRNLGSWVEVPWVGGNQGVAYLHVNAGSIAQRTSAVSGTAQSGNGSMSSMPDNPAALSDRILAAGQANGQPHSNGQAHSNGSGSVPLPRHMGLGARMNAATLGFGAGFGATVRTWRTNSLGLQFDVLHSRLPSLQGIGHVTSLQFAPSVVYSLPSAVTSSVWLRPYIGGGGVIYRTSINSALANIDGAAGEKGLGFQSFGGAETTFAGAPQFAVSAEVGYRWWQQVSTVGVTPSKVGVSLSAHWYVK